MEVRATAKYSILSTEEPAISPPNVATAQSVKNKSPFLQAHSRGNPMDSQDRSHEIALYVGDTTLAGPAPPIPDTPISVDSQHSSVPFLGDFGDIDDLLVPAVSPILHRAAVVMVPQSPISSKALAAHSSSLEDPQINRLIQMWSDASLRSLPLEPGLENKDETFWKVFLESLPSQLPHPAMPACLNALYQLERKYPNSYKEWLKRCGIEESSSTQRFATKRSLPATSSIANESTGESFTTATQESSLTPSPKALTETPSLQEKTGSNEALEKPTIESPTVDAARVELALAEQWMNPSLCSLPIQDVSSLDMTAFLDALSAPRLSIVSLKAMNALYGLDRIHSEKYSALLHYVEQHSVDATPVSPKQPRTQSNAGDNNDSFGDKTSSVHDQSSESISGNTLVEDEMTALEESQVYAEKLETAETNKTEKPQAVYEPETAEKPHARYEPETAAELETAAAASEINGTSNLSSNLPMESSDDRLSPLFFGSKDKEIFQLLSESDVGPHSVTTTLETTEAAITQDVQESRSILFPQPETQEFETKDVPEQQFDHDAASFATSETVMSCTVEHRGADDAIPVSSTSSLKSTDSSSGIDILPLKLEGHPGMTAPSYSEIIKKTATANAPSIKPVFQETFDSSKRNAVVAKRSESKTKFVPSLSAVVSVSSDSKPIKPVDENQDLFDGAIVIVLMTSSPSHAEIARQQKIVADTLKEANLENFMIVDGKDKANKGKQKTLFNVSGSYGEYPQIFNRDSNGNISFWGNFDTFVKSKKRGSLISELLFRKMSDIEQQGEKSLLVLVSNQSLKQDVKVRQMQALSILDAHGIQYDTLDGADPINKSRRSELFALSGSVGQYPQFFVVGPDASIKHWGDWDHFESANESGSLAKEFRASAIVPLDHESGKTPHSLLDSNIKLVCLTSSQSIDRDVRHRQEMSFAIFADKSIPYESIDGADPANKPLRNMLFEISGLRAFYPQFFLFKNSEYIYIGDWEKLEVCNETNSMAAFFTPTHRIEPKAGTEVKEKSLDQTPSKKEKPESPKRTLSTQPTPTMNNLSHASTDGLDTKIVSSNNTTKKLAATSEITFYGATSFVAKHALDYMMQVSLTLTGVRKITLAGRDLAKIDKLQKTLTDKMGNLRTLNPNALGRCTFDSFIADSNDFERLLAMASRTKVVACFAGPFAKYSEKVLAACAKAGTDYVDITGEVSWSSAMRLKYSSLAESSGARIISFCGFDSVPSDLAIYAAAENMKRKLGRSTVLASGTTWHYCLGYANGGTIQTIVETPLNIRQCLFRTVPFLLDDPLALAHPHVKFDEKNNQRKNLLAKTEWMNQLVRPEPFLRLGFSAPFFMAPINTKVVNASAAALGYGTNFVYRERFLPLGFRVTKAMSLLSIVSALIVQFGALLIGFILKFPILGKVIAGILFPAGSGMSDQACSKGLCEIYAEVVTAEKDGKVDRVYCAMKFEGDPGNWVTAQCVCESALALVLDRSKLPKRSIDGFGTPAELLGSVLLQRLETSKVRPVEVKTYLQRNTGPNDRVLCHFE